MPERTHRRTGSDGSLRLKRSMSFPERLLLAGRLTTGADFPEKSKLSTKRKIKKLATYAVVCTCLAFLVAYLKGGVFGPKTPQNCPPLVRGIDSNLSDKNTGTRIVIFTGAYNNVIDGVSRTLNRLVKDLLSSNYRVLVLAPTKEVAVQEHYGTILSVPSMKLPFRAEYSVTTGLSQCMRSELEAFNPDIVHIATPDVVAPQVVTWAEKHHTPVVCSYHTRFTSYLPYYFKGLTLDAMDTTVWWWLRKFHKRCEHIYPPTTSVVNELISQGMDKDTMRLWPRGINLTIFNPDHRNYTLRKTWGANNDTVVILVVTRMVWEKNIRLYVDVCRALLDGKAPIRAVLVGDGPALPTVKELLPNALYTGSLAKDELSQAYASADIFFFPSVTETWGSVTLEAMASGLAVVVAAGPTGSELVEDGVTGIRVNITNYGAAVTALSAVVSNQQLRQRLAHNARKRVSNASDWSWAYANNMLKSHYQEILNRKLAYED
eukprot:m.1009686 g.1009686  ORF g.1009686 m.1009686 type:complete len:490 (-) comp24059_c0_seq11:5857-7326(-)